MNVRTLTVRTSLPTLRAEIIYSLARLKAHPLAAPHVPTFEVLRSECDAVFTTETTLRDSLAEAEAAIDMRDEALDDGADRADDGDQRGRQPFIVFALGEDAHVEPRVRRQHVLKRR